MIAWIKESVGNWLKGMVVSTPERMLGSHWKSVFRQVWRLIEKRNQRLFFFLTVLCATYWPEPWKLSFVWAFTLTGIHLLFIFVEYMWSSYDIAKNIESWKKLAEMEDTNVGSALVVRPHMSTFVFKDGVNVSDMETVQRIFFSFAMTYGFAQQQIGTKKNRKTLMKEIKNLLDKASFVSEMNRKIQDYVLTTSNFDEVVDDMTSLMKPYCSVESFHAFRTTIAAAVQRGLKMCATTVYEDGVNVLSITQDHFFLVAFTLKIVRTEKGWIISTPVITGKYASFLLRVSTAEFLKAINFDADKPDSSGTTVIIEHGVL